MVRNTVGGNKSKGQARKHVSSGGKANADLRISEDACEVYAIVEKMLGNGMFHVLCDDGLTRLCHIRGKFRGRGKSDNIVKNGSWLLVGIREWEHGKDPTSKKLQNCDLLEVYTEHEKEKLKTTIKINWSLFTSNDNKNMNLADEIGSFVFSDEKAEEYRDIIESEMATSKNNNSVSIIVDVAGDEINVDDI